MLLSNQVSFSDALGSIPELLLNTEYRITFIKNKNDFPGIHDN